MDKRKHARLLRKQGKYLREIADILGISVATASLYCRDVLAKGKHPLTENKQEIGGVLAELYKRGMAIPAIAEVVKIPAATLYDWRREFGVERNPRSIYVTDDLRARISRSLSRDKTGAKRAEAVRLYVEEKYSTPEIARNLRVSAVTVGNWLKAEGLELRKSPTERTRHKLRQANLGERRYNWKGGITPSRIKERGSLLMKLAREACFRRDGFQCRSCGNRGGRLNAHHIWPFHRFPEMKYDVRNLMTLCKQCHDHFHKAAGGHVHVAIGPFTASRINIPQNVGRE